MASIDVFQGMEATAIFEHFPNPMVVVQENGRVSHVNREAGLLLGTAPQQLVGRPFDQLLTMQGRGAKGAFDRAWQSGRPVKDEPAEVRVKGESLRVTLSAFKVPGNGGHFLLVSLKNASREAAVIRALRDVAARAATTADALAVMGEGSVQKVTEIRTAMQEIADGTQVQAQKVEETVDVIKELAMSIDAINEHAQRASSKAQAQAVTAREGTTVASQALDGIKVIIRGVQSTRDGVKELATHVEEIEQILDFVRDISQQSNMLALNASIEAARAGEHGRAFAVVADEVKRLSEHTRDSITKVNNIISEVKDETSLAIEAIEARTTEVQSSATFVQDALGRFDQMAADILESSELLESISQATIEQKRGAGAIVGAIDEVAQVAEETSTNTDSTFGLAEEMAGGMEAINAAAHELTAIANSLHATLDRYFHLGSAHVSGDEIGLPTAADATRSERKA